MAQNNQEYIPEGATLVNPSQNSEEYMPEGAIPRMSAGDYINQAGNTITNAINAAGGTLGKAIGYGVQDFVNAPIALGNLLNRGAASLLGMDPNKIPQPMYLNAVTPQTQMPGVSQQLQQKLEPVSQALGMTANIAIPASAALELGSTAGKTGLNLALSKLGLNPAENANNFMNNLLQGNKISDIPKIIGNELRNRFSNNMAASANEYNPIKAEAMNRGYVGGPIDPSTGIAPKGINPTDFQNKLSSIDLDAYPKDVKDLLNPFVNKVDTSLSFNDAHNLQSDLGSEGAKLNTSSDSDKRSLGKELLGLRGTLKNDIVNNLNANGDNDLANAYQKASNNYLNNVAPYMENSTIRKVVTGKGLKEINPSNIGNVLKKDDGSILPIANDLSPQSRNLLLAQQLKPSTGLETTEGGAAQRTTDPQKIINNYNNLDNTGNAHLMTNQNNAAIANIQKSLNTANNLKGALRSLKGPAKFALGGVAAGLGFRYGYRPFFGHEEGGE